MCKLLKEGTSKNFRRLHKRGKGKTPFRALQTKKTISDTNNLTNRPKKLIKDSLRFLAAKNTQSMLLLEIAR